MEALNEYNRVTETRKISSQQCQANVRLFLEQITHVGIFFLPFPTQVRSLSTYLEMEGYDRPPFTALQLESFHRHVTQRLEQEKGTLGQVMVRNSQLK